MQLKSTVSSHRIKSIDLLRGIVIVIMALDHVRDYFHADAFVYDPLDLSQTSVVLFFTRWITHFCAPVFIFLAGTSAFISGSRKNVRELSAFLFKRGLWLIILEFTVLNFGWFFNIKFEFIGLIVIWALGIGMIVLAGLVYLPWKWVLVIGLVMVFGHNALDAIHVPGTGIDSFGWSLIHEQRLFQLTETRSLFVGYPLVPWIGVMALGYCLGNLYKPAVETAKRKKSLLIIGSLSVLLFIVLRFTNLYGDPNPWLVQSSPVYTFLSFLNVSKYPPSLLYLLITLGLAILVLAFAEGVSNAFSRFALVFGRVPMCFYILHIYLIHILALIAALFTGYKVSDMIFSAWINTSASLHGYGFNLLTTYMVWFAVVAALYPVCKWYGEYKRVNREKWWLSYL